MHPIKSLSLIVTLLGAVNVAPTSVATSAQQHHAHDASTTSAPLISQAVLKTHGHPQKSEYTSSAEWPLVSAQGHWAPANRMGTIGHTHVECWAPLWAELPRAPFTLPCRVQLFHVAGGIWGGTYGVFGNMARSIDWDRPDPVVGNPAGVVIRNFRITIDPTLPLVNGGGSEALFVPENGWFQVVLTAFTLLENGTMTRTELWMPFYATGDPAVPETKQPFGFDFLLSARTSASAPGSGNGHGTSISEYRDAYLPILAPLTAGVAIPGSTYAYARGLEWPTPHFDRWKQVVDADLHNGIPGTTVQELGTVHTGVTSDVIFDPSIGPGLHRVALIWEQETSAGNASFNAAEMLSSLLVVTFRVGDGVPLPPPPSTDPVPCQGVWTIKALWLGGWRFTFTITQAPANGGAACPASFTMRIGGN